MITLDTIREIILALPGTEETSSWGNPSFKVNGKAMLFWNLEYGCPVFKLPFEERDHLIELDPDTFFTTDHHRPYPMVLARPDRVDVEWVRANLMRVWRDQAKKTVVKAWDAGR
ncbi:MmcQ/YjbR family DNA-binding protein [Rhizobium sp. G187]|uniref:MmcQ/YjbR family DNA-binding protein n=1 Tax=Rhizobium sp. G187 TaxID=3451352 RepID=UPI003EE4ADF4